MKSLVEIDLEKLYEAYLWVDCSEIQPTYAVINLRTGEIVLCGLADKSWPATEDPQHESSDEDEEFGKFSGPDWVGIPGKRTLDHGARLVYRFADLHLPQHREEIRYIFSRRGAYRNFHAELLRLGKLQAWYDYKEAEIRTDLREWAEAQGFLVV